MCKKKTLGWNFSNVVKIKTNDLMNRCSVRRGCPGSCRKSLTLVEQVLWLLRFKAPWGPQAAAGLCYFNRNKYEVKTKTVNISQTSSGPGKHLRTLEFLCSRLSWFENTDSKFLYSRVTRLLFHPSLFSCCWGVTSYSPLLASVIPVFP